MALIVLVVLFSVGLLNAEARFGERPFIDIYKVPDSAMEQGHIRIKLSDKHSLLAQELQYRSGDIESFGIEELDELAQQFQVTKITRVFSGLTRDHKYAARHIEWGLHLWFELEYESRADIRSMVMAYRGLEESVQWAEPEYKKTMMSVNSDEVAAINETLTRWTPNDTRYGEQWHYHNTGQTGGTVDADIDLPQAWDIEKGHPDVIVDVQDGGIQQDHPDLNGNLWINTDEIAGNGIDDDGNGYIDDRTGYNFVAGNGTIVGHFHGTHVAGTIAAESNNSTGVAGIAGGNGATRGVSLMSTQVFTDASSGGFENAPIYGADNGAAISQNSWGYTYVGVYDQVVLDAIDYFNTNGGGVVMDGGITIYAAGNGESSGQWWPGCYSGAFSVAATTHEDTKAWYSNYDTWVDVSAPGGETAVSQEGVLSTYTGSAYNFLQGTSMACPHTSGVAALVLSYSYRNGRILSNTELADIIRNTTDNHYGVNPSYIGQLGSGRINAYAALMAANPALPSCTITSPADGSVFNLNSSITINVTATDNDGTITGVAFYIDNVLQYTDTTSPYSWVWDSTGYAGGSHTIKVIATDNSSNSVERSVSITLLAPPDEGFETGDFSAYPWVNNSSVPWTVQSSEKFSGTYAAKSGTILANNSTSLSLPVLVSSSGNITFYYKVSSESGYDYLRFYIDDVQQAQWSGAAGWAAATYPVSSGSHTFRWTYSKDGSVDSGSDCAWLDHIILPPMGTYYAPPRNLAATSGNGVVNLSWQAPASGSPTGYKVYRNSAYLATTAALSYNDTAVVNDTNYQYYCTAVYGTNESEASNTVDAYPTANPLSTIIIGNGTGSQTYPIDRYYNYSGHEAIYLASQIGTACNISSLGFYKASGTDVNAINAVSIYMKHTTDSSLSTGTYSTSGYTLVYSGSFPNTATSGWMEVPLNNLFAYNGTDNLAILTIKGYQAYISSGYPYWTYTTSSSTQARQNRNDDAQPASLTASNNLPNIKLQVYLPQGILYPARNLSAAPGNGFVVLNWDAPMSGSPTGYKIYRNSSLLTTVAVPGYTDNAVVNGTTYSYYVVAAYSTGDADPTATVNATPDLISEVVIGSGTGSNGVTDGAPINVYYQSLHGQSVYTAAELNAAGVFGPVQINQIGFNVTGLPSLAMPNYLVRVGHTTATDVASWIPATNLSAVWSAASYQPSVTGWNMFELDPPFEWNGEDNFVVDTAFGLIGSWTQTGTVQITSVNNGYRYTRNDYDDQTEIFTGGSATNNRPNLKIRVDVSEPIGPEIEVMPLSLDFGTIPINTTEVRQFIIENVGDEPLTGSITTPAGFSVAVSGRVASPFTTTAGTKTSRNTLPYTVAAGSYQEYNVSFNPTLEQVYTGNIVITSNDADEPSVNVLVEGTAYNPNQAPTIELPDHFDFAKNDTLVEDFSLFVSDPDDDPLTLTCVGNSNIDVEIDGLMVTFSSPTGWVGIENMTFTISDGQLQDNGDVAVNSYNTPPWVNLPASFEFARNGNLEEDLAPYGGDDDGDDLEITYSGNTHIQIVLNGTIATFTTIPAGWVGTESVTFTVDDGYSQASDAVDITVTNSAPWLDLPASFEFARNGNLEEDLAPYGGDDDGDDLEITYSGNTHIQILLNGTIATFTTDPVGWVGTETVTFTVDDGYSQASDTMDISVFNNAPTIVLPPAFGFDMGQQLVVDFSPYLYDANADALTLQYSGNTNVHVSIDGLNVTFSAVADWHGMELLTFTVSDGLDQNSTSVEVFVNFVLSYLDPPVVTISKPLGSMYLQWEAVPNATAYEIYRCTTPDGMYEVVVTTSDLFWTDPQGFDMAFYKVRAINNPPVKK
jgi:subtilisin family serine protease